MSQWVKLKAMVFLQRHRRAAHGQDGAQRAPCLQLFAGEIMNKNNFNDLQNVVVNQSIVSKVAVRNNKASTYI